MAVIKFLRDINNLGYIDRAVRVLLGLALLIPILSLRLSLSDTPIGWEGWLALIAVYPVITAVVSWDPFYALIGIQTHRPSKALSDDVLEHDAKVTHDFLVDHHVIPPSVEQYEKAHENTRAQKKAG